MKECYIYYRQLREELDRWLSQSIRMDIPGPNKGGEDEANYSLAWFPHYLVTASEAVAARFRSLLSDLDNWVKTDCLHGYELEAEAHHGTEPFLLFLPRYLGLFPEDETARRILEDAAHHIGNWVKEIPAWYDYEKDCFYSYYIGTRTVGQDPKFAYELAEHLRFIHIALAAYRVLGEERYLQWALRYGRCRAQRILDAGDGPMPVLWEIEGKGLREDNLTTEEQHGMAGSGHHIEGDPLAGIENLLASGAIYAFGDLFLLSGEDIFRQAARKIAEPLVDELLDPYCDPGAAAVGYYRWTFDDDSLDERILKVFSNIPPDSDAKLAMIFPQEYRRREPGVGKRNDMVYWGVWTEDGSVTPIREPSTAALSLAYQMTGELGFAKRALKSASTRLRMARRVLRGGREHSDMGGAICSVAAGHGRNWGHGAVTGCYGPLLLGTRVIQNRLTPLIEVRDESQLARLPVEILSLVIPPVRRKGEVLFFNGSDKTVTFSWRCTKTEETGWRQVRLAPNESQRFSIG
ncbi:TPA: hypothetical protein EYP66_14120 [Candidatus Poribacteria bacterium]|nr:hypothetical protein [Candidatus Poribacteria bacterium]